MIRKQLKLVITVHTTTEALMMEEIFKSNNVPGRLIPVPSSISAGCGLAWMTDTKEKDIVETLLSDKGLSPQGYHEVEI